MPRAPRVKPSAAATHAPPDSPGFLTLGQIGAKRVVTIGEARTVQDAARIMNRNRTGCVVVTRSGRSVGIVTERDVLAVVAQGRSPHHLKIRDVMSRPVIVGEEQNDLQDAMKLMVLHNIKKLPIVRGRRLVGIVTLTDFARIEPFYHDILARALERADARARRTFSKYVATREPPPGMYA